MNKCSYDAGKLPEADSAEPDSCGAGKTMMNNTMMNDNELYDLAELFKILGDFTRIRILHVLLEKEVCVAEIAEALQMTQSAISHQLRILKTARLVKARREGKSVLYSLADEHVRTIMAQGEEHIRE